MDLADSRRVNVYSGKKSFSVNKFLHSEVMIIAISIWSVMATFYLIIKFFKDSNVIRVLKQEWILVAIYSLVVIMLIKIISDVIRRKKNIAGILKHIEKIIPDNEKDKTDLLIDNLKSLSLASYKKNIFLSNLSGLKDVELKGIRLSVSLQKVRFKLSRIIDSVFGNRNPFEFRNVKLNSGEILRSAFVKGIFTHVYFIKTLIRDTLFDKISFTDTQFDHTKIWNIRFTNCVFNNPVRLNVKNESVESFNVMVTPGFVCSRLDKVEFDNVIFNDIDFTGTGLLNCKFTNVSGLTPEHFHFVATLYNTELPEEIAKSLRNTHPELFNKSSKAKLSKVDNR
ncbi:MAG: hypothetical protein JW894_12700 [Bacteroidales bacterium]|nr:hypothetical protein [Bacteroidales bacterium]